MKSTVLKLKNKSKKLFLIALILFFMAMLIIFPDKYTKSCYKGITLWGLIVLPSLLPFFFLTQLFTFTGVLNSLSRKATKLTYPLFKCSGLSLYAFLMSILSGYPVGSRIVYDLKSSGLITKGEATKIGLLASTSGPLFIISAVGIGMFNSKTIGIIIYVSHIISAVLVGLLFKNYSKEKSSNFTLFTCNTQENILYTSIYNSVISAIIVGGFISVFFVFAEILQDAKILFPLEKFFEFIFSLLGGDSKTAKAFTIGLIECTSGAKQLSVLSNTKLSSSLTCALISFGGISIIMQSLIYLERAEVKPIIFILGKLCQTIFSFIICFTLVNFYL